MSEITSNIQPNSASNLSAEKNISPVSTKEFDKKVNDPKLVSAKGARELKNTTLPITDELVNSAENSVKQADELVADAQATEESVERIEQITPHLEEASKDLRQDARALESAAKTIGQRADALGNPPHYSDRGQAKAELKSFAALLRSDAHELRRSARRIDANIQRARRIVRTFSEWIDQEREVKFANIKIERLERKEKYEMKSNELIEEKRVNLVLLTRELISQRFHERLEENTKLLESQQIKVDLVSELSEISRVNRIYEINIGNQLNAFNKYLANKKPDTPASESKVNNMPPIPTVIKA